MRIFHGERFSEKSCSQIHIYKKKTRYSKTNTFYSFYSGHNKVIFIYFLNLINVAVVTLSGTYLSFDNRNRCRKLHRFQYSKIQLEAYIESRSNRTSLIIIINNNTFRHIDRDSF